jgi:hypothetical protein
MAKRSKKRWIQSAIKKPGALREALGVPEGKPIPASKLEPKPTDSPLMRRRKALARTLRRLARRRRK